MPGLYALRWRLVYLELRQRDVRTELRRDLRHMPGGLRMHSVCAELRKGYMRIGVR